VVVISVNFKSSKNKVQGQFDRNIAKALAALGLEQNANAMAEMDSLIYNAPTSASGYRRTGLLRSSMDSVVNVDAKEVVVGSKAEYGIFVTMGTRHMATKPFMQNSLNNYQDGYKRIVEEILGEGF